MEHILSQKFLLLAKHPTKSRFVISDIHLNYGLIGAILMEMANEKKISLQDKKLVLENYSHKDYIYNEVSSIISNSKRNKKIKFWINKLSRKSSKYRYIIFKELAKTNKARIEKKSFLGIKYNRYYLIENLSRQKLIEEIRHEILFNKAISEESISLIGLIEACKMHHLFSKDRKELKDIRKKTKQIIQGSPIAGIVDETIREVQAAIIGAIVATSAASAAASSG